MTLSIIPSRTQSASGSVPSTFLWRLPVAVTAGCLLALAMTALKALAVWRTGIFFDPDDAMRAVEVRDFLHGQSWFDLVQHRLSPDHPFAMHWSRLADLPLAASILALERIVHPDTAERITRLLEPSLFYVVYLTALARLARSLVGERGPLAAVLLATGALEAVSDFIPGHIHHHALQLMLLALASKLVCDALDPLRYGRMAWAGAVNALSLAINLQNLPFVAMQAGVLGLLWASQRLTFDRALRRFGLGLLAGVAAVFFAQIPPSRYLIGSCDAFGAPHLVAVAGGSLFLIALSALAGRLRSAAARLVAVCAAGTAVLLLVGLTYPACLGDPYAALDPLVRERWMGEVGEAMPILKLLVRDPWRTVPILLALALGLAGTLAAVRCETGLTRARWIVILALSLVGLAGTFWQVRVAASAEVFGALGGAWWLCRSFGTYAAPRRYGALLCVLTGLGLTQAGWTAALSAAQAFGVEPRRAAGPLPPVDADACFAPTAYDALRQLPPGLVLSTIDPGAHILAYTGHSAIAAPYHRDGYGIRVALLVFEAPPEAARPLILESQARYLALCTTSPETHDIVRGAPNGLGAEILAGDLPPWLQALPSGTGPLKLFEVVPDLRR